MLRNLLTAFVHCVLLAFVWHCHRTLGSACGGQRQYVSFLSNPRCEGTLPELNTDRDAISGMFSEIPRSAKQPHQPQLRPEAPARTAAPTAAPGRALGTRSRAGRAGEGTANVLLSVGKPSNKHRVPGLLNCQWNK